MTVTLVRHTAPDVAPGTCYGFSDVAVAPAFADEANAVASAIDVSAYRYIYSSPLSRCSSLARYCCGDRDIVFDSDLREMNFGEWEMMRYDECVDPRLAEYYADYLRYRCPGGESFQDLGLRVRRFISRLDDAPTLIFTHGGVIAHFLIIAGKVTPDKPFVNAPGYGSITTLVL